MELLKYMIENDKSNFMVFLINILYKLKKENAVTPSKNVTNKIISLIDLSNTEIFAIIVISFLFDNLIDNNNDIRTIVNNEEFIYPTNGYGLTNVNGAIFKKNGLIFDGKGYYYNYFINKTMINQTDEMLGFAKIINEQEQNYDILYRLDERLSVPECEYYDYSGVPFAKYYGPQFHFNNIQLKERKTIIVHIDQNTLDKLLMVIKKGIDQIENEEFLHIELETLPYRDTSQANVITTFLHGIYYPDKNFFTHIDYTKNQYSGNVYLQKYEDSKNGVPIDQYTETKDLHYKIWCVENGKFSIETWYKLMKISLSDLYQKLLDEILK